MVAMNTQSCNVYPEADTTLTTAGGRSLAPALLTSWVSSVDSIIGSLLVATAQLMSRSGVGIGSMSVASYVTGTARPEQARQEVPANAENGPALIGIGLAIPAQEAHLMDFNLPP